MPRVKFVLRFEYIKEIKSLYDLSRLPDTRIPVVQEKVSSIQHALIKVTTMRSKLLSGMLAVCIAICVLATISEANAACKRPVGVFTGAGNGLAYFMDTGNTAEAAVIALSINIYTNGAAYAVEQGKSLTTGLYNRTWTVSPTNNSFSLSTCQGTLVNSFGQQFTYTSSNSGKVVTFIYTTNDNILAMYSFRLEKV